MVYASRFAVILRRDGAVIERWLAGPDTIGEVLGRLPDEVRIVRHWSGHPHSMIFGIDGNCAAAIYTGYHDAAGTDTQGGADLIDAGTGNDSVVLGAGNDTVTGGLGADTIQGGEGSDTVYGDDTLGTDTLGGADVHTRKSGVAHLAYDGDEAVIEFAGIGEQRLATAELEAQYLGYAWFIKPKAAKDVRSELPEYELPKGWFWRVIWRFRRYYYQVIIATFLINFLALVSSLYVMNVYDRVIPNKSMETLWVLSIGVSLAIFFEFLAKLIRGHLTDIAGKKADLIISAALFRRVMQLRMADKPASSGSYAMSGLHDEKVDAAISKAAATQPGDERHKAIMAAEQAILASGAAIPLAHERVIQGEAAGVTGAQRDPGERALITSATTVKK